MKKATFLIIRFSSIGDIVLTSPLVRCLKQQVKDCDIHFVTKKRYGELLEANPYIDRVHLLSDNFGQLIDDLRDVNPDYVIDLHQNIRSQRIKRSLRAPAYSFNKLNFRKWMLVNLKINRLPDQHIVDRYFLTVSSFGVKSDGKGLDHFIPDGKGYPLEKLPPRFRNGFIAFILSGTWPTKQLPGRKVMEICREFNFPVVLIGGEGEKQMSESIISGTGDNVLNLTGKTTIHESADLVRQARVVLTNDTGMMHIASAFGKKILSFWGNTVPQFGMYPYKPHPDSLMAEVKELPCRPCSKLGYRECPRGHFRCMEEIDVPTVIQWIRIHFNQ